MVNPERLAPYRGHPTSPGPRDEYVPRRGRDDVADGKPGIPRLRPTPFSHADGMPGHSPAGPIQPDVFYEGWDEANQ
jgi:hypothetical protein